MSVCLFLPPGDGPPGLTGPLHGEPSLAGVFSAALCQSGPGGAGAGLQAERGLDQHRGVPDPHYDRRGRTHPCQGAPA